MAEIQHILTVAAQKEWSDWGIPLASAIVTFLALCFAIFRDFLLGIINKPKFIFQASIQEPFITKATIAGGVRDKPPVSAEGLCLHIAIINKGKGMAKDCVAQLSKIFSETSAGSGCYEQRKNYIPANLNWALGKEVTNIMRDEDKYIDLGTVLRQLDNHSDLGFTDAKNMKIYFHNEMPDGVLRNLEHGKKHRLIISICGSNFNPVRNNCFELFIPSEWPREHENIQQMVSGFTIRTIPHASC